jgi:hypothetical protein
LFFDKYPDLDGFCLSFRQGRDCVCAYVASAQARDR